MSRGGDEELERRMEGEANGRRGQVDGSTCSPYTSRRTMDLGDLHSSISTAVIMSINKSRLIHSQPVTRRIGPSVSDGNIFLGRETKD